MERDKLSRRRIIAAAENNGFCKAFHEEEAETIRCTNELSLDSTSISPFVLDLFEM